MIKDIKIVNNKPCVFFERKEKEKVAAYLYRRDICVEKIMYSDSDKIHFTHKMDHYVNYHIVGYVRNYNTNQSLVEKSNYFYIKDDFLIKIETSKLYESENVLISSYSQGANITVVTFNGTRTTKKTKAFGLNFVLENGWNCISVHQDNDSQYQDLSQELFYEVVKDHLENKRIYTYGVSLGGYCAIYYGGIINAIIIAGSPKNSAHPNFLKKRFEHLTFLHKDIKNSIRSKYSPIIFYDPFQLEDVRFVNEEIIPIYPDTFFVPLPKAGHRVLETLSSYNLLKKTIISIVEKDNLFLIANSILRDYYSAINK